jgi:hypothetical protein
LRWTHQIDPAARATGTVVLFLSSTLRQIAAGGFIVSKQPEPTIQVVIDDATAQGEYINFANIIHSPSEFVVDLGRMVPGKQDVKVYSRIIMTPLHTKQLLQALAQNVAMFEQKFGEIRLDNAAFASATQEPSN